jgi:predicted MPP superfamily phosphohydrolase
MRRILGSWIFFVLFILVDIYVFQALRVIAESWQPRARWWLYLTYWTITLVSVGFIVSIVFTGVAGWPRLFRTYLFAILIGLFLAKITASFFFLADDLRRMLQWSASFFIGKKSVDVVSANASGFPRSVFLSWVGLITGGGLFGTLVYGFGNKYSYEARKHRLHFPNLPQAFRGFKILHISDIHSGSFTDKKAVEKGVELILQQNADVILFTGDIVNQSADEMDPYVDLFTRLSAPHGVYATLGNHDYGFPVADSEKERLRLQREMAVQVESVHRRMGWKTLSNQHTTIDINGEKIALIGVENISGRANFPSFGILSDAYKGIENIPFKILMSHDPSHWNKEVTTAFKDIDLTLSGHTHGMQFGVELPWFRWSPVKYIYKQWAGHYKEGNQHLYVNRGFGFIGYPGRVGILPEITVLELV